MVALRLSRRGTKDRPFYKIVAVDSRDRRDGRFIEQIGTYDPLEQGVNYQIDLEKTDRWIGHGAQPSATVASIIKKARSGETPREKKVKEPAPAPKEEAKEEVPAPETKEETPAAEAAEAPAPEAKEEAPAAEETPAAEAQEAPAAEAPADEAPKPEEKKDGE